MTKDCSTEPYGGLAGDFCTITESSLAAIMLPAKVTYARALDGIHSMALNSNIVLDDGTGNTASGHVHFDLVSGTGDGTFSGGTGTLAGFHAQFHITVDATTGLFHFDGTYSFNPPN